MDIEESKILLKDFKEGKIEKDKLENYTGGYKIGYFYTKDIQEAIDAVLSELEKKECKYIRQDNDWIVYQCSNCKMDWVFEDDEPKDSEINYCPKCGAKITGVIELEEEEE